MPTLPLPICKESLCSERVLQRGNSFCLKHQREEYKKIAKFKSDPFYWTRAWRRVREVWLMSNPECVECKKMNRVTRANTVDHIIPRSQGGSDYDAVNLQSLCESCHQRKRTSEKKS